MRSSRPNRLTRLEPTAMTVRHNLAYAAAAAQPGPLARRRHCGRCKVDACRNSRGSLGSSSGCSSRLAGSTTDRISTRTIKTRRLSSRWTPLSAWAAACLRRNSGSSRHGPRFTGRNCNTTGSYCNPASRPSRSNHSGRA